MDSTGKVIMESILETKASTILEFFAGLRGTRSVTLEEGTWAAWLYDLLKPHVANVVVCNPRKNGRQEKPSKAALLNRTSAQRIPSRPGALCSNKGRIHLRRPSCHFHFSLATKRRTI